jgi:hypothetical protein
MTSLCAFDLWMDGRGQPALLWDTLVAFLSGAPVSLHPDRRIRAIQSKLVLLASRACTRVQDARALYEKLCWRVSSDSGELPFGHADLHDMIEEFLGGGEGEAVADRARQRRHKWSPALEEPERRPKAKRARDQEEEEAMRTPPRKTARALVAPGAPRRRRRVVRLDHVLEGLQI